MTQRVSPVFLMPPLLRVWKFHTRAPRGGGGWGTCRAKILEGKVRMERNFALDKKEVANGFILTCQAHPLTPRVVLSFDEL